MKKLKEEISKWEAAHKNDKESGSSLAERSRGIVSGLKKALDIVKDNREEFYMCKCPAKPDDCSEWNNGECNLT